MPRFVQTRLAEIANRITELGLQRCPVCGSDTALGAAQLPALIQLGGDVSTERTPGSDVRHGIVVTCQICGHMMFFDPQMFVGDDEPLFEN
jgi:hypothetical protein